MPVCVGAAALGNTKQENGKASERNGGASIYSLLRKSKRLNARTGCNWVPRKRMRETKNLR